MRTVVVTNLIFGETYRFIVQSQNSFGVSINSTELILTCAGTPNAPNPPTTSINGNSLVVTWTAPSS